MPRGGARPGGGRKSIAEELGTRDLARKAIIDRWGSLDEGLKALLNMGEPALIKFVFEHAFGKSPEHIDLTSNGKELKTITGMIVK
jgi:hypothetical protein